MSVLAPLPLDRSSDLEEAYESCRQETAQWAKTFYLGTMLLPPAKRWFARQAMGLGTRSL